MQLSEGTKPYFKREGIIVEGLRAHVLGWHQGICSLLSIIMTVVMPM